MRKSLPMDTHNKSIRPIFLDYAASTPLAPEVAALAMEYENSLYANPSSIHQEGSKVRVEIETARASVAALIGATKDQILFTSGATESINFALKGLIFSEYLKKKFFEEISVITTAGEHSATRNTIEFLQNLGVRVNEVPLTSRGIMDLKELENLLRTETPTLFSFILVNNETGVVNPIKEILELMSKYPEIKVHIDATQAVGKISPKFYSVTRNPRIDILSISSHKIYGPKGIGALYKKPEVALVPLLHGGLQERRLRSGTENFQGILGFAKAAELTLENPDYKNEKLKEISEYLLTELRKIEGLKFYGDREIATSQILNFGIHQKDGLELLVKFDQNKIAVSIGSACYSGTHKPSHVLKAMGESDQNAQSAVRISYGRYSTLEEAQTFISTLKMILIG